MRHLFLALITILALVLSACQPGTATPTPLPATPGPTQAASPMPYPPATPGSSQPVIPPAYPPPTLEPIGPAPTPGAANVAISAKQRVTAPQAPESDQNTLVQGNTAFALDLYRALLAQASGNLIFSPFSISQALAMTYAGARGQTEQQMAQTLHFALPQTSLHPAFNALDLALQTAGTDPGQGQFQVNIANALWGQTGYPFLPDFLDQLAENYGAGIQLTDFSQAPEPARQAINQWVSEQTKNKINDLLPPSAITSDTRLTLVNAIYFYAKWLYPFDANLTQPRDFTLLDGTAVSVPMMSLGHIAALKYAQGPGYQAVELPYTGERAALTLLVPDAGRFAEVQTALAASQLGDLWERLETKQVELSLPKFKYESSFGLADTLGQMGMADAVNPSAADFSGMDGGRNLYISAVVHKAMVAVDEDGTEAAAATAVTVGITSLPVVDVQLTVDRPFLFVIRDTQSGSILFMGQVVNPK